MAVTDEQAKDVGRDSIEAAIVRVLLEFQKRCKDPTCQEVFNDVLLAEQGNTPDLEKWLNPRKLGQIVRDQLGLRTKHKERGSVVVLDAKRLIALASKFE